MKKYWQKPLATVMLAAALVGCSDFENININPNSPSSPSTAGLLTGVIRNVGTINAQVGPGAANIVPAMYVQQFGDVTYIEDSKYKTINFSYNGWYAGPLANLQHIIELNTKEDTKISAAAFGSNNNQIATARILKAYFFQWITDRWGDVPYSEALKGDGDFTPAFDKQEAIYTDLFKEWKEAAAQFDGGKAFQGDILLGGNTAQWKKFANSLRLIAALRLSKVKPDLGKQEFAAALKDGVFTAGTDNVQYKFLSESSNENPLYNNYTVNNRKDFAVSDVMVDYLKKTADPRLPFLAAKNILGEYVGVPYAVGGKKAQDVSLIGSILSQQNSAVNVLTYAQVLFAQAEAAKLGWTTDNAKTLYEAAVQASLQQWMGASYTEAAYKAFIAKPEVAYTEATALEKIGTQRWIALYFQGTEAWSEWRRTGYPVLKPAANTLNGGTAIPRRLAYPVTENTLNQENYKAVVASQGADDHYTRVWWDKQ
ncbi:SusD/RagB family nutrient-binding outer membrane lipoprotein [Dyadobacter sp. CY326]|uniref:SusD/RagB family nutrient-binding outer membrane lipoprotein n=1 Tax=Dyadobacter sp. CY326 TaxID=2907300 RepID=UPI001F24CAEE|nr:SusD/RagB family nutrient-binding outer membrane lipoprotein [Dyadobacter sp. CY326]MCE7065002.1 SusD/RagB family nutrient-binding outer membrane lipoprotein [Dyadobacter sp. CY326]